MEKEKKFEYLVYWRKLIDIIQVKDILGATFWINRHISALTKVNLLRKHKPGRKRKR